MTMGRSVRGADRPKLDHSVPAVVLKLDRNVMHHGGLGAIRTLGRLGVDVYGVHEGPLAPAASSRYLQGRCFWQPGSSDPDVIVAGLTRLSEAIGRQAVLITTDDAGAIFLAEHGAQLASRFLFPAPPADLPGRLAGKHSAYELCRELEVPCARSAVPESLADALAFGRDAGYPVIAKLMTPWRVPATTLRSTSLLRDEAGLEACYQAAALHGAGLMLQEFIPATTGCDWFVHGYCDASSACGQAFTGIKERSYPAYAGLTSLGRAADNPRLRAEMASLTSRLGYRGIFDLDLRWDHRDDAYKLLDFNPRLGAQFMLFRDLQGRDVVQAAYLDLTGQPAAASAQEPGRRYLVENYDALGALRYWRDGELSARSWLNSLRGVSELAWFARDDLRPFGLMCVRMGWRMISRPLSSRLPGSGSPGQRRTEDLPVIRRGRAARERRHQKADPRPESEAADSREEQSGPRQAGAPSASHRDYHEEAQVGRG
jgi:D-aspartate ligase